MLALLTGISIPTFNNFFQNSLEKFTTHLSGLIKETKNKASRENETYVIQFDLGNDRIHIAPESKRLRSVDEKANTTDDETQEIFLKDIEDKLIINSVKYNNRLYDSNLVNIKVRPSGFIDTFLITFSSDDGKIDYEVVSVLGKTKVGASQSFF